MKEGFAKAPLRWAGRNKTDPLVIEAQKAKPNDRERHSELPIVSTDGRGDHLATVAEENKLRVVGHDNADHAQHVDNHPRVEHQGNDGCDQRDVERIQPVVQKLPAKTTTRKAFRAGLFPVDTARI